MKPVDIAALRALDAKATKNWRQGHVEKDRIFTPDDALMGPERVLFLVANRYFPSEDDVALAVEARNALPALLDTLDAYGALADAARQALAEIRRGAITRGGERGIHMGNASMALSVALEAVRPHFRAGDVVKHHPTGETWTLAYAENDRGDVSACGWPESIARAADCSLIKAATDEAHLEMLRTWAGRTTGDHRRAVCRRQLAALEGR